MTDKKKKGSPTMFKFLKRHLEYEAQRPPDKRRLPVPVYEFAPQPIEEKKVEMEVMKNASVPKRKFELFRDNLPLLQTNLYPLKKSMH